MTHAYRCCEHAKEIQNDSKKLFAEEITGGLGNNFRFSFARHLHRESCVFTHRRLFCKCVQRTREIDSHKFSGEKTRSVSRSIESQSDFYYDATLNSASSEADPGSPNKTCQNGRLELGSDSIRIEQVRRNTYFTAKRVSTASPVATPRNANHVPPY
jgi:hypothetical protein